MLLPALAGAAVSCSVSSTGPVFGNYNPFSATPTYANGQIKATCTLLSGGTTTVNLVSSYSIGNRARLRVALCALGHQQT